MTRRDRRAEVRLARRDLKRRGCTCRPTVELLPVAHIRAQGATSGAMVSHEAGCPLGDIFVPWNKAGFMPAVSTYGPRCYR